MSTPTPQPTAEPPLTVQQGLQIQRDQMKVWNSKLQPTFMFKVCQRVLKENERLTKNSTGYDVFRGCQIDELVHNLKP